MKKLFFSFFLLLAAHCQLVVAGGFQVNLQGQKQIGMAHTGTGLLLDGASLLFNPGATSFLDSIRLVQIGGSFVIPRTVYLEPAPGVYSSEMVHHVGTPFTMYAVYKIKPEHKMNFGLGIYTPFGSRVEWPIDWKGQFLIREMELKTIFIQPTLSYKVSDKIGIGAGFVYATGGFGLKKGVPVQDTLGNYGEASLSGDASGMGYNAGIYFKPNDKWSFGVDYRSSVKVSVDGGSASFVVPSSLEEYFPTTAFSASITMPHVLSFGTGFSPNEKLKIAFDVNHIGWHVYDTLAFDFADTTAKLQNIRSPRIYKDAFILRAGAQYQLKKNLSVRGGAYYDISPVQDGYLTPETPDANRIGLSMGASWKVAKKLNLDFSLLYIEGAKRSDKNIETEFEGTYKTKAVVPGIAIEFLF
ncbi:MAG: long-chain fatty acid transporter [Bacteroidetes bacterium]|nr:MAG: long-chain fatty acid transporter [Bacteroidota bacterium]